jgi:hypothetical protein
MIELDEFGRIRKEMIVACFNALSRQKHMLNRKGAGYVPSEYSPNRPF